MRKITREIVALLAVFVIYFGYSAWYNGATADMDLVPKSILEPFKLVLVGGVFGLLVPLTKSIFFGTISGIKDYVKARRNNVLYNYQATIAFVSDLKATLETGDYEQIKAKYAAYNGLAFKPKFLDNMMDEIGDSLIREQDMSIYIEPSDVVLRSIKQMYEKERKLAISQKPTEMFFDFKRGYEYTSMGSKYSIAYFKALDTKADSKAKLGWKLFSLEMFKFVVAMLGAIIPTIIVSVIVIPLVANLVKGDSKATAYVTPSVIFGSLMIFAIAIHAAMVFSKSQYRVMWKSLIVPAVVYYVIMLLIAATFVLGLTQLISGMKDKWNSTDGLWTFFSLLTSLVLSTTLMMYVMATLMDGFSSPTGMTTKLLVDGIVLPLIAWVAAIVLSSLAAFVPAWQGTLVEHAADADHKDKWTTFDANATGTALSSAAFGVTIAFWIYLSISSVLMNNIVFPSRKQKMAMKAELAQEGTADVEKQEAADKTRADK